MPNKLLSYQSGDLARYRNIGDNDRLFCEIKFSFYPSAGICKRLLKNFKITNVFHLNP